MPARGTGLGASRPPNLWTIGSSPGTQTVTATVAPGVSATFTASVSP
jgi:hypothetical protein